LAASRLRKSIGTKRKTLEAVAALELEGVEAEELVQEAEAEQAVDLALALAQAQEPAAVVVAEVAEAVQELVAAAREEPTG
jgi:hypothetical protein